MARPKKPDGEKRTVKIELRLSPAEKKRIKQIALEAGYTPSDLIRTNILAVEQVRKLPSPERETLLKLNGELGKIGSNMNQIAHVLNRRELTGEAIGIPPEIIADAFRSIDGLSQLLIKVLTDGHYR